MTGREGAEGFRRMFLGPDPEEIFITSAHSPLRHLGAGGLASIRARGQLESSVLRHRRLFSSQLRKLRHQAGQHSGA